MTTPLMSHDEVIEQLSLMANAKRYFIFKAPSSESHCSDLASDIYCIYMLIVVVADSGAAQFGNNL